MIHDRFRLKTELLEVFLKYKVGKMEIFTMNTLPFKLNASESKIKETLTRTDGSRFESKRPSYGKLQLANFKKLPNSFLHTSNLHQITAHRNLQHLVADLVQWHSRRTEKQKRREETESDGEMGRFGRNPVCPLAPPSFSFVFTIYVDYR